MVRFILKERSSKSLNLELLIIMVQPIIVLLVYNPNQVNHLNFVEEHYWP